MVKRPAILRSLRARETFWFYVFASPWILGFLIFYLGPMLASFGLSLTNYSVLMPTRFMGLDNYRSMFEDDLLGISIWNTAYYAALAVPSSMAAGLGLAMLLNRDDLRGRSFSGRPSMCRRSCRWWRFRFCGSGCCSPVSA